MARPLLYYLPLVPSICMVCMIIGVGVWVHYTAEVLHQVEYALEVLGPTVTADNLGRGVEAIKGTSSSYLLLACALFGLGLYRRLLSAQHDTSGPNPKQLLIYRAVNAGVHFLWWLVMVWVVLLWAGLAVLAILTWVGKRAVRQVLANQAAMAPLYSRWAGDVAGWALPPDALAAAGGDVIVAITRRSGWPAVLTCPSTCANLQLFQFLAVDSSQACVCDQGVLSTVLAATQAAQEAVPGMFVGIWFMYVFGDLLKTSLACDFTGASRDAEGGSGSLPGPAGGGGAGAGGLGLRKVPSTGRGYTKL
ncbi:hypothetical protein GPECTOR_7g1047 [Gonium pectorale]|uniref:Uncharacterized protein n=1 Tax=Gonium pectorale TaxID=33097 RepID=A0A150GTG3_GONPE|nr:hypothetical protein GPECTOR_7g1047 [Gonium pectorale]|eukprot:KXZ53155.1 hypothetical protein GPECTOR_7g1047 [Gonium pectorale]